MKIRNSILLFALLTFTMVSLTMGQTYKNVEITPRTAVGSKVQEINLYTSQFLQNSTPQANSVSNDVFVRQIGNNNAFQAELRSAVSNVSAFQFGNNNEAYLDLEAVGIDEQILQRGFNNVFYDIGTSAQLFHSGRVVQNGSNQELYVIGSNSMSDRMKINMRGNNQTVIIRNVKRQ
ncbi:hypothetical protein J1N09_05405 [Aureitalea sp. L0-47]|uniref:hypothetical protein n=1 Tax=Aureitalea sp. L0-47 TaxID=2816962 RepID=UPI002238F461|nr:hypothetical protein [Aureitalea sp. L0-47]MCW5519265.1 hypothetical protein [Aureitalea sp. L0-47]